MSSKYNLKLYVLKVDHIITNPKLNIKAAAVAKSKMKIGGSINSYDIFTFWDRTNEAVCLKLACE